MSTDPVVYEIHFSQAFYNSGVSLGPEQHAAGRMDALRQAFINVAILDPKVSAAQFGLLTGNGPGNEWHIQFTEKDYHLNIQFDNHKKPKFGAESRKIGYILSVTVIQTNIPNGGVSSTPPRQLLISLT